MPKIILITGGVVSSVGKGIITSSLGYLLRTFGVNITCIKIDPYLNIDAGTMSPFEHGEVFVLQDGGEVDLDLGNYERFLDLVLTKDNNITTGKIFDLILQKERQGHFLGKTVQIVPHVTGMIKEWILRVARIPTDGTDKVPDVCLIELGGTPGDIESMTFYESLRQLRFELGTDQFLHIHATFVPELSLSGEQKSKPAQQHLVELRKAGLNADVIICRSKIKSSEKILKKISLYGMVKYEDIISLPDLKSIYEVPKMLKNQNLVNKILSKIGLKNVNVDLPLKLMDQINDYEQKSDKLQKLKIAFVGKYFGQGSDCYISLLTALKTAARFVRVNLSIEYIDSELIKNPEQLFNPLSFDGVLIPGGFGVRGIEGKIMAANFARTKNIPFLGICLGMQIAVIEFARSVLNFKNANSTEFDSKTPFPVVTKIPEIADSQMGGNMRVGAVKTRILSNSLFQDLYRSYSTKKNLVGSDLAGNMAKNVVEERYRHRYEVNIKYQKEFENEKFRFSARDDGGTRLEACEYEKNDFYLGVQFHPEFQNNPRRGCPVLIGFLDAAKKFKSLLKN